MTLWCSVHYDVNRNAFHYDTQFNINTNLCELTHQHARYPSIITLLNLFRPSNCNLQCEFKLQLQSSTAINDTHSRQPHYRSVRINSLPCAIPINHYPLQLVSSIQSQPSMRIQTSTSVINRDQRYSLTSTSLPIRAN